MFYEDNGETYYCPECDGKMVKVDETYSNINTERCRAGDKTGDIYHCESCNNHYIDDYLTGKLTNWYY